MTQFKVTNIVDGDTFDVTPGWTWNGNQGTRVRPAGYDAPELLSQSGEAAKSRLSKLLYGKMVELGEAYRIDRGRIVCEVFFNGVNLAKYFPKI